jgi:hypothetical protein
MRSSSACLALLLVARVSFQVPAETNQASLPLQEVAPGIFQIGKVRLNKPERTVSIPVVVNMRTGVVEYLLVHKNGKTHESVLRTEAEPYHIHVATLLLGAQGRGTNSFPADKKQPPPGDPTLLTISWTNNSQRVSLRAEQLIIERTTMKSMPAVNWIYNGSLVDGDGFAAQQTGSIVSLIDDADALLNNPLPQRDDDENWLVAGETLKKIRGPAELVLSFPNAENRRR